MAENILVIVEQREGKLNRVSWETIAAGQAIAALTGWTLEAAVVGRASRLLLPRLLLRKLLGFMTSSLLGWSLILRMLLCMGCGNFWGSIRLLWC